MQRNFACTFVCFLFLLIRCSNPHESENESDARFVFNGTAVPGISTVGMLIKKMENASGGYDRQRCTATLLCSSAAITAEHCVRDADRLFMTLAGDATIAESDSTSPKLDPSREIDAAGNVVTVKVEKGTMKDGVSLIHFDDPFPKQPKYVALGNKNTLVSWKAHAVGVQGYGQKSNAGGEGIRRKGQMLLNQIWAGNLTDADVIGLKKTSANQSLCAGDSGGPVIGDQNLLAVFAGSTAGTCSNHATDYAIAVHPAIATIQAKLSAWCGKKKVCVDLSADSVVTVSLSHQGYLGNNPNSANTIYFPSVPEGRGTPPPSSCFEVPAGNQVTLHAYASAPKNFSGSLVISCHDGSTASTPIQYGSGIGRTAVALPVSTNDATCSVVAKGRIR